MENDLCKYFLIGLHTDCRKKCATKPSTRLVRALSRCSALGKPEIFPMGICASLMEPG